MSFWKKMTKSFLPNFYKDAAYFSNAEAVKYLFLLILITSLILSTYYIFSLKNITLNFLQEKREELPKLLQDTIVPLTIKDGKVSAEVKQPYIKIFKDGEELKDEEKFEFVFIIDTTGEIISLKDYKNGILLTENNLIIQNQNRGTTEIKKHDLSEIKDFSIRPTQAKDEYFIISKDDRDYHITYNLLIRWIKRLSLIGWPILLVFLYILLTLGKFIQVFICSLFTLILNITSGKKLKYSNIFNVGIFAITAPTTVAIVHILSGLNFKYFKFFYIFLYLMYLTLGFTYAKEKLFVKEEIIEGK